MADIKKLKREIKRLKKALRDEKRQRKYAERDATMWCDILLDEEDASQLKDLMIADLGAEIEKLKASKITMYLGDEKTGIEMNPVSLKLFIQAIRIDTLVTEVRCFVHKSEDDIMSKFEHEQGAYYIISELERMLEQVKGGECEGGG